MYDLYRIVYSIEYSIFSVCFSFFLYFQIRHILENGSLYFPKFDATGFRQDVHWTVYKCIASNAGGTIISRDLSIKAGIFG